MTGQLLPLRLIRCSSAILHPSAALPVLRRPFPFNLRYPSLLLTPHTRNPDVRSFSARRGEFASASAAGQGRSLVDDEADLSDWVSDLKPDFIVESSDIDGGSKSKRRNESGAEGELGSFDAVRLSRGSRRFDDDGEKGFSGDRWEGKRGGRAAGRESADRNLDRTAGRDRRNSGFSSPVDRRGGLGLGRGPRADGRKNAFRSLSSEDEGGFSGGRQNGMRGGKLRGAPSFAGRERGDRNLDRMVGRDRRSSGFSSPSVSRRGGGIDGRRTTFGSSEEEDEDEGFSGDRRRGMRGGRVGSAQSLGRRGGGNHNLDRVAGRNRRSSGFSSQSVTEFELSEDEDDRRRGTRGGHVGSAPSLGRRGGGNHNLDRVAGRNRRSSGFSSQSVTEFELSEDEDEDDSSNDKSSSEEGLFSEDEDENVEGVMRNDSLQTRTSPLKRVDGDGPQSKPRVVTGKDESYLSETRFDQCSLSPLSLKGIKAAGYERMTMVQEATLPVILKGKDVLAKAKTGTGKTVAFLLPAIEIVVKQPPVDRDNRRPPVHVLVVCPTRELANQAATEASTLLKFHPNLGVQFVTGGTRLALEQKRLQANPCQILVATPGRLRDHLENTPGFATRLMGVKVLVLDEADHLLDMGFRKDIEKITAAVPKQRQSLLFSATVPDEVRQICHIVLKRDHEFINTVEEGSEETHSQVLQSLMVAPLEKHFPLLYHILQEHIADDVDYKVLVFCTTAMVTRLVAEILSELKLNVREIHSRKPQSYRTRVSDEFRKSKGLILVTSDVSARGVDYPDVTLVVQVGVPSDREQYIHRLGRTGRKGKEGEGILMLAPWEEYFASTIKDLPISKASSPPIDPDTSKKVERALNHVEMKVKESAYQAWLGYYNSNRSVGKDKHKLVELASEFSRSMGLDNPPAISKLVLGKMGLKNVPGLRSK